MSSPKYLIGNSKYLKTILKADNLHSPHLIITSPPYYDVLNYENNTLQVGQGQTYDEYLDTISDIIQQCYEISAENATLWLIVDTFRRNGEVKTLPFDVFSRLKSKHSPTWKLKDIIILNKEKNLPWVGNGRFKNEFEYILFLTKNRFVFNIDGIRETNDLKNWWFSYPERYNARGKAPSNIWNHITPMRGWGNGTVDHLCPFPFSLVEKIISIASNENDVVLDPFAGSGTVLAMAQIMGRRAVGIDVNEKYKTLFETVVLDAAARYWNRRSKEIEGVQKAQNEFELLNISLRKLKYAGMFKREAIDDVKLKKCPLVLLDLTNTPNRRTELIIVTDQCTMDKDLSPYISEIKSAKFGLAINVKLMSAEEFKNSYSRDQFFEYTAAIWNRHLGQLQAEDIVNRIGDCSTVFFSNITVEKIPKILQRR